MLKVGITQEELNGCPRTIIDDTHLSMFDIPNGEIPKILVDIATYMQ